MNCPIFLHDFLSFYAVSFAATFCCGHATLSLPYQNIGCVMKRGGVSLVIMCSILWQDADLLAVLGDLLDTDDFDRLTAQQTLQHAYFCKCV